MSGGPTNEPDVVVESRDAGPPRRTVFLDLVTGERWAEVGECNRCGLCEIGSAGEDALVWDPALRRGEPYSCSDPSYGTRPEVVNRPSIKAAVEAMAAALGLTNGCTFEYEQLGPVAMGRNGT